MLQAFAKKKLNPQTIAKTISKLTVHAKLLKNYLSHAKIKILICQVNVQSLVRVSELRAYHPNQYVSGIRFINYAASSANYKIIQNRVDRSNVFVYFSLLWDEP